MPSSAETGGDVAGDWGGFDGSVNQALQSYLRELGQLPKLSTEELAALGNQILNAENKWRNVLYSLAFTARWQYDFLSGKDQSQWRELFIPSALTGNVQTDTLESWLKDIDVLESQLVSAFQNGRTEQLEPLRQQLISEMNKYKLSCDILSRCYEQLLTSGEVSQESIKIRAAESACSESEFTALLEQCRQYWRELLDLRQKMVESNLRLVVRIVNQYSYRQLSVSDLVQEGNIGLMRSLEKFDFNLKHKFSTYASWWIRQSIGRAVAEQFRVIRIPAHMVSTIAAINRTEQRFIMEYGRMPEVAEIAAVLEMPAARVSAIRKMARQTISLQSPLSVDTDGSNLEDVLPDEQAVDPAQEISDATVHKQLIRLLAGVTERERMILTMRFGLMGQRVRTLQEISDHFNISRERVRQLEMQTLNKLRTDENLRLFGVGKS